MDTHSAAVNGVNVTIEDLLAIRDRVSRLSLRQYQKLSIVDLESRAARIRGHGMEYEESRAYVVGDDIKCMDWRVMARTGEAHTKVFSEERNRSIMIAAELSASMFFGTSIGFKSWAAVHLAAHLAWLVTLADDCCGGLVVTADSLHRVNPGKSRSSMLSFFYRLVEACNQNLPAPTSASRLNAMLAELLRSSRAGNSIFLLSDFLGLDDTSIELLQALVKKNEVRAFWISDRIETDPWKPDLYPVQIGRESLILDSRDRKVAKWISVQQQQHRSRVENTMARFAIGLQHVSCNRDISDQLLSDIP